VHPSRKSLLTPAQPTLRLWPLFAEQASERVFMGSLQGLRRVDFEAVWRLVVVSFCHIVVNVFGFCLGFSPFGSSRLGFPARHSCQALPRVSRAETTSPKVLYGLLGLFGLLIVGPSAAGAELEVAGGVIEIEFVRSVSTGWESVARQWVERSARAVSDYYGRFPVPRLRLRIASSAGRKATDGNANGWRGPLISIALGRDATTASLADDWLLTHEMVHLAFPTLSRQHHWLEEGLATYVEPIAQARAGLLTPERVWSDFVVGLPQGQPQSGDRGLDGTPTWGRTYWGGALFCLRADLLIRERTGNRYGLEHSLRAILAAGGSIDRDWSVDRVLDVADQAVGVPVLRELYEEMAFQPVMVDLQTLWQQLGIRRQGNTVIFDDRAPLASIRNAITPRVQSAR
jgi:hypothetical protein